MSNLIFFTMAIFLTNQVGHLYVAKALQDDVASLSDVGDVAVGSNEDGFYITQKGIGGIVRSDLIPFKNIISISNTEGSSQRRPLKKVTITLSSDVLSSTNLAYTGNYMLKVCFTNLLSLSPDNSYWKYGVVYATAGTSASNFYKKLAIALAKAFAREATPLVKIYAGATEVTASTEESDLSSTYTSVVIEEVEQPWKLGLKSSKALQFYVEPVTVSTTDGELVWANAADGASSTVVKNGKKIADMEWFYLGERGDYYRGIDYPDGITTEGLVDPTKEYDIINVHYFYNGSNHAVQKSEKDLIIVGEHTVIPDVYEAIEAVISPAAEEEPANEEIGG